MAADASAAPRVSFLLFSYRQEAYIEAAMRAALAQTYQPLEIIVSDDASPDGTFAVIERIAAEYDGPHTLIINRNPANLGMGAHYQHIFARAQGEIFVLAAGDDISAPDRTSAIVAAFAAEPDVGIVYSDMDVIDAHGAIIEPYRHYYSQADINDRAKFLWHDATIFGASFAISRALYDRFPPILAWNEIEDRLLIFRCLISDLTLRHIALPLVAWRRVGRSSGTNQAYDDANLDRLQRYMPDQVCVRWLLTSVRQHLVDYWGIGGRDLAIQRVLQAREAELTLTLALWRQADRPWARLRAALRAGARAAPTLKLFAKFRFAGTYLSLIGRWQRLRKLPLAMRD